MANIELKNYISLMDIARKNKGTDKVNKYDVLSLIEDIAFDIEHADKVVTSRIFSVVEDIFDVDNKTAKDIVKAFSDKIDISVYESDMYFDIEMITEKARPPKLRGKELKARSAKSEVMSKLNKNEQFISAKDKLLRLATVLARKYAKESGLNPKLVNVDKITVRK